MEALNRLADNSDNWQPRKTRYEPCLSVPPTRITRPLLASPNRVFNSERTNERAPPLRASKAFFAPPETCRSRPPVNDGAIVDEEKKEKRRRRGRRGRKFFERYRRRTSKLLFIFRKRDECFVVVCRIVVDSILINR